MITQRKLDIWRLEAQMKTQKAFGKWLVEFLGKRGGANDYQSRRKAANAKQSYL